MTIARRSGCRHPPLDPAVRHSAIEEGRRLLARKARTFHLATSMLPLDLRNDIAVLYAFCRMADDVVDESEDGEELDRVEAELAGRVAARPVIAALRELANRSHFSLAHARTLLQGVRVDLVPVRIEDDAQLLGYSYRVASTVGLMLCRVLGVTNRAADPFAIDLGLAMQLTNIVRDVREDAERGRVYLPRTRLAQYGVAPEDLLSGQAPREAILQVCLEVLELADRYYASAEQGLRFIPAAARFGIAIAARVYASIGWRIRRTGHNPLDGRMVVARPEKLWRVSGALVASVRCSLGASATQRHDRALHRPLRMEAGLAGPRA